MKNKKYHTVRTITKSNRKKIIETESKAIMFIPNTHIL